MSTYKKVIQDLFSSINNVKVNKTVISEPDLVEFKVGKDNFQLTTDELLDATVFTKKYIKMKGALLPVFTNIEWSGFVTNLYKKAEFVEAQEFSDVVLTGKLFIDHLNDLSSTKVAANTSYILLEQDGLFYLRFNAVRKWVNNFNPNLQLSTLSKILVELGVKVPGYKNISFLDGEVHETQIYWGFTRSGQ